MSKQKRRVGAPTSVWTAEYKADLLRKMVEYTDSKPVPVLAEFAYVNNVHRQDLYAHAEFSDAIKRMMAKKEYALEMGGLMNKLNPSVTIFSLKQLGWTDKQTLDHTGSINHSLRDGDTYKRLAEIIEKLEIGKDLASILARTGVAESRS